MHEPLMAVIHLLEQAEQFLYLPLPFAGIGFRGNLFFEPVDLLPDLQFRRDKTGIFQDAPGHAQFLRHHGQVFFRQRFAGAGQIGKFTALHRSKDVLFGQLLEMSHLKKHNASHFYGQKNDFGKPITESGIKMGNSD